MEDGRKGCSYFAHLIINILLRNVLLKLELCLKQDSGIIYSLLLPPKSRKQDSPRVLVSRATTLIPFGITREQKEIPGTENTYWKHH